MNSRSEVPAIDSQPALKAGIIKRFVQATVFQVLRATILFVAAFVLAVFLSAPWSSLLQAGSIKAPSNAQTVKPMSSLVDSASLVHLLDSLIVPGLEKYHIPGMVIAIVHDDDIVLAKGYG
jgi:CubicO group peptidase (beta-lactamase class C family)